ncbi:hypothetical protein ACQKKX_12945 [Neorhizobium sp. NPDC001467]|uniref:hypothetical protein n=1 Tax=Neorhizobium sp. NPDC001467 TaxID=3390595 RepID=UPI003CFBEB09
MTTDAISSLRRSLFSGNDAALLVTPAMGSSATTMPGRPLIPQGTLETGFRNDTGRPALAKIVEILDLMRPLRKGSDSFAQETDARQENERAVSAFLDSLEENEIFSQPVASAQPSMADLYRQF